MYAPPTKRDPEGNKLHPNPKYTYTWNQQKMKTTKHTPGNTVNEEPILRAIGVWQDTHRTDDMSTSSPPPLKVMFQKLTDLRRTTHCFHS